MDRNDCKRRIYRGFLYRLMRFALVLSSLVILLPLPPVIWLFSAVLSVSIAYQTGYLAVALTVCKNE